MIAAVATLLILAPISWHQTFAWKNQDTIAQRILWIAPNSFDVHMELGDYHLGRGSHSAALAHFRKALSIGSSCCSSMAHSALGQAYAAAGDLQAATRELEAALVLQPEAANYSNLGQAYAALGRLEDAAQAFRASLKLRPFYPLTHADLSEVLKRQGHQELARFHANEMLRLTPCQWATDRRMAAQPTAVITSDDLPKDCPS